MPRELLTIAGIIFALSGNQELARHAIGAALTVVGAGSAARALSGFAPSDGSDAA
jgi:hypothetical protein